MKRNNLIDWGSSLGILLAHIGNFIYLPLLISQLGSGYSGFWAGFVVCMTYVGRVSASFCYTSISKTYSLRNIIGFFVIIEGLALLGMGLTGTLFGYSILAFFVGFASGISFLALKHLLSSLPEKVRLSAFSRFQLAAQGGLVIGAIIGGFWSPEQMGTVFFVTFLLFVSYAVVIFLVVPVDENISGQYSENKKIPLFDFSLLKSAHFPDIKYDLFFSMFYWILIMSFMVNMPLSIKAYLPSISVSMPFWLTGSILLLLLMPLSKYAEKMFGSALTMTIGCGALVCGFISLTFYSSLVCVVSGCVLIALGQIFFAPALDMHVSRSVGKDNMGKAMSSMHFYRSFGNMIGTISAGILFDIGNRFHIFNLSWIVFAIIAFILTVGCFAQARARLVTSQVAI